MYHELEMSMTLFACSFLACRCTKLWWVVWVVLLWWSAQQNEWWGPNLVQGFRFTNSTSFSPTSIDHNLMYKYLNLVFLKIIEPWHKWGLRVSSQFEYFSNFEYFESLISIWIFLKFCVFWEFNLNLSISQNFEYFESLISIWVFLKILSILRV